MMNKKYTRFDEAFDRLMSQYKTNLLWYVQDSNSETVQNANGKLYKNRSTAEHDAEELSKNGRGYSVELWPEFSDALSPNTNFEIVED